MAGGTKQNKKQKTNLLETEAFLAPAAVKVGAVNNAKADSKYQFQKFHLQPHEDQQTLQSQSCKGY